LSDKVTDKASVNSADVSPDNPVKDIQILRKINSELFDNAPTNNGVPILSASKIFDTLKKYGLKDATRSEDF
jgi:hypothetical protein